MRIGLIAYLLHGGQGYRAAGVSTYINRLIEVLPAACPHHDYVVFHGPDAPVLRGVESARSPLPTYRAPVRILWEQTMLPAQAAAYRLDVLHGLVNVLPMLSRAPGVVTLHDLAFLRHPERFDRSKAAYLRAAVASSTRKARAVIAISENTLREAVELLRVPPERISVVHPAADPSFAPQPQEEALQFRQTMLGGRPYVLYVGTLEPRKNVDLLIRAFADVRRDLHLPHRLVLVGGRGWMYESLFDLVRDLGLSGVVRFQGYARREALPLWYNAADLFAYPSVYEGFGLPVLEAMACGVPCITTASSSLVEVAGSACLTVEPGSQEALAAAMRDMLESRDMRDRHREAGLCRAAQFSWQHTADRTVQVYKQVIGA